MNRVKAHQCRLKNRRVSACAAHGDVYLRARSLRENALTPAELAGWREFSIRQRGRITDAELRLSPEAAAYSCLCLLVALRDTLSADAWEATYRDIGNAASAYHLKKLADGDPHAH